MDAHSAFIDEVLDDYFAWTDSHRWRPNEDSPWGREKAMFGRQYGPGGDWPADLMAANLRGFSSTLLGITSQHLEAVKALIDARQIIVCLPPLVRSIFEASCRICWLIAPLDRRELRNYQREARIRAARLTWVHLEDATRAKTAMGQLGDPGVQRWAKEVRKVRKEAIPAWFYPSEIELGKDHDFISFCGETMIGLRQGALYYEKVWKSSWRAGGVYDFLSNSTHPTPHSMLYVSKTSENGLRQFAVDDVANLAKLARIAVVAFLQAWHLIALYLGLPQDEVNELLERSNQLPA